MKPEEVMNALQQEIHRIYGSVLSVQKVLETFDYENSCNERVQSMKEHLSIVHSRLEGLFYLIQECKRTVQDDKKEEQEELDLWM